MDYKIGDKCTSGFVITDIIGASSNCIVFITADTIRYEYNGSKGSDQQQLIPAISMFHKLSSERKVVLPSKYHDNIGRRLGEALFAALSEVEHNENSLEYFADVESFIRKHANYHSRYIYAISCIICAITIIPALLYYLKQSPNVDLHVFISAGIAGIAGALVSVFQRVSNLNFEVHTHNPYTILQGISRVLIGLAFGVFIAIVIKANLALGFIDNSDYAIIGFAFVSGVSERLVPEIIQKMESSEKEQDTDS